jgi:hypothetical protein
MKENGIWMAILISAYVTLVLNYWYYRTGRWKKIKLLHGEVQAKVMTEQETEKPI